MYLVIKKDKLEYFGGFTSDGKPEWVRVKSKAWTSELIMAKATALLLSNYDSSVNKEPVKI